MRCRVGVVEGCYECAVGCWADMLSAAEVMMGSMGAAGMGGAGRVVWAVGAALGMHKVRRAARV